jgi:6-pyruvoyltetrahydropterin/6-carboxytetrahydropterin synthase
MTVFPDGTKERLHGHNYFVGVALELADISFSNIVPFQKIKDLLGLMCQEWKEHTLVPAQNPFFEPVRDEAGEYEFRLCGKRYVLPREDVLVLPLDNIAVEPLSFYFAEQFAKRLQSILEPGILIGIEVNISEVPGQGASAQLSWRDEPAG